MTHLMEPYPFIPAGAVRSAMPSIGQAPERTQRIQQKWLPVLRLDARQQKPWAGKPALGGTDMAHRRPSFRARWRRYGPLAVRQTAAETMPCQQTRKDGQMGHYQEPLVSTC